MFFRRTDLTKGFILITLFGTLLWLNNFNFIEDFHNEKKENDEIIIKSRNSTSKLIKPVHILWTQWRSGSTILGRLLAEAHPSTFYSYEPLHNFGMVFFQDFKDRDSRIAVARFKEVTNCDIDSAWFKKHYSKNFVRKSNPILRGEATKTDTRILRQLCREEASRHVIKVLRLSLFFAEEVLKSNEQIKILYMIRDPRATFRSRSLAPFCSKQAKVCSDPAIVCNIFSNDYHYAVSLSEKFPTRFKAFRYEDFSLEPEIYFRKMSKFLGEEYTPAVEEFLHNQTTTYTKHHVFMWRESFPYHKVMEIQNSCEQMMNLYGYRMYSSSKEYLSIDPLLPKTNYFL